MKERILIIIYRCKKFYLESLIILFGILLIFQFFFSNIIDLMHRFSRYRFYITFKRVNYWKKEFIALAYRNWLFRPFNVKHAKKRLSIGFPISFSRVGKFIVSLFNPFSSFLYGCFKTYHLIIQIIRKFLFYYKLKLRLFLFNVFFFYRSYAFFLIMCVKLILLIFLVLFLFFFLNGCFLNYIYIYKIKLIYVVYFKIFSFFWLFFLVYKLFFLEEYALQIKNFGLILNHFSEEKYYASMGFVTFQDIFASNRNIYNEPRVFFNSFPVQYLSDFQYILGSFFLNVNYDVYIEEYENFKKKYINFFGFYSFNHLNSFHYVLDGVDLHIGAKDSVWLLSTNSQFPVLAIDTLPTFLNINYLTNVTVPPPMPLIYEDVGC